MQVINRSVRVAFVTLAVLGIQNVALAAQTIADKIIGAYDLPNNKNLIVSGIKVSDNALSLKLLNNRKYVLTGSDTTITGDWQLVDDNSVYLTPDRPKYPFSVLGRHNDKLKDTTKLNFEGKSFGDNTLIHYGDITEKTPTLTPIFQQGVECRRNSFNVSIPHNYNAIALAYNPEFENKADKEVLVYTFNNSQNFNDFYIFESVGSMRRQLIKAKFAGDRLIFSDFEAEKTESANDLNKDAEVLSEMTKKGLSLPKTLYRNSNGNAFVAPYAYSKDYKFDNALKAYVPKNKHSKNATADVDLDSHTNKGLDNDAVFYEYKSLDDVSVQLSPFKLADKPVFHSDCLY